MRWFTFFIVSYLMLGVQLGAGSFISYRDVSPNLPLLVVIFISLNASKNAALLGSFVIGCMQDLGTLQPLGLFAFAYGIISLLIVSSVESVRRSHPLTHLSFTFLAGILLGMLLIVHDFFKPTGASVVYGGTVIGALRIGPRVVAVSVIYTTLLAPLVIGLLQLAQSLFAFEQHGRRRK